MVSLHGAPPEAECHMCLNLYKCLEYRHYASILPVSYTPLAENFNGLLLRTTAR